MSAMQEENVIDSLTGTEFVDEDTVDEKLDKAVTKVSVEEVKIKSPEKASLKFRSQLSPEDLKAVESSAPALVKKFVNNYSSIIDFGSEVMENVNNINSRLLDEQKDTEIPEADAIVNGILKEIDGYSAKYSDPKLKNFISKMFLKVKGTGYTLKSMIRDSQPIANKLDIASGQLQKMENELRDNVIRGHELRKATLKALNDMVKILAVFEEVIDVSRQTSLQMDTALKNAHKGGDDSIIQWDNKSYTIEEFKEIFENQTSSLGEIEKTWFAWRQKFFLYGANVTATRNIINMSFGLQRTCQRVRVDAIPAARNQLVVWQQAEKGRQGAHMAENANRGVDRLLAGSSQGTADAVAEIATANQRSMVSEDTIMKITDGIRDQFTSIVEAEKNGREIRERSLKVIQQSESAIQQASEDAQTALIENAMISVRNDADAIKKHDTKNVLDQLGVK